MFPQMRRLPDDVVKAWDGNHEDEEPRYVKNMRAVRQMNGARARFMLLLPASGAFAVGILVGWRVPTLIWIPIILASLLALILQAVGWLRAYATAMRVSKEIDDGIKIVEPRAPTKEGV